MSNSSDPASSDQPIFSDSPIEPSSPPSSPPTFPWEQNARSENTATSPKKAIASALSLLGKRKALEPTSENDRSAKRHAKQTAPTGPKRQTETESQGLTQMQISLGQKVQHRCKTCGMEYIPSSAEDRKLHDKYHKQNTEGYDVGKDFVAKSRDGTLFKAANGTDAIVAVDASNAWRRKRARAALDVVQRELGAVEIENEKLCKEFTVHLGILACISPCTTYMYIKGTKCIGLLLVEQIQEARQVVKPEHLDKSEADKSRSKSSVTALEALKARRACETDSTKVTTPIELSKQIVPAVLGISRIWTSSQHRGQGIATALLDTALMHHNQQVRRNNVLASKCEPSAPGKSDVEYLKVLKEVGKEDVAFSQPTESGAKLARKWFGKGYGWKVYVD